MVTRYVSLSSNFDLKTWSDAIARECDEHSIEFVSQYMGTPVSTLRGWITAYKSAYGEFPHPHMTNFLKFCNSFGYDPRDFFAISE